MGAVEARRNGSHQDSSNSLLLLMFGSIKSQRSGIKLRRDFARRMASVMVIGSEVFGSCVEGIRVEAGQQIVEALFALSCFSSGLIRRVVG